LAAEMHPIAVGKPTARAAHAHTPPGFPVVMEKFLALRGRRAGLSDAERVVILGETAATLLAIEPT
jgi:hypothetical protein